MKAGSLPDWSQACVCNSTMGFATKPEIARNMLRRALKAGVPARWVIADEVYGSDSKFRRLIEETGLGYVVAVTSAQRLLPGRSLRTRRRLRRQGRQRGLAPAQLRRRLEGP